MPTPATSLNALVPWSLLLDVLELNVRLLVLPARVQCPLCKQEQLNITEDYLAGGQWFHCRNCKESGDMIELAAKVWGLSIEATIIKLMRRGIDLPVDDVTVHNYLTGHIEYRERLCRLWGQAQPHVYRQSPFLRSLLYKMRLPDALSAKILGGERCQTIEEALLAG